MKPLSTDADKVLRNLLFELTETKGPKLLIAVCNHRERCRNLRSQIDAEVREVQKLPFEITVPVFRHSLVDAILGKHKAGENVVVHLIEGHRATRNQIDRFFGELNFQRDALNRLAIPIVLWISSQRLQKLASRAPDFWSRRTGVYYFDAYPTSALLQRIFRKKVVVDKSGLDRVISNALNAILVSERELKICLKRPNFSLQNADALIKTIRESLAIVLSQSQKGRQIEIAFWLWNAAHMDGTYQPIIARTGTAISDTYEVLYADRTEILLEMAKEIPEVLEKYSESLNRGIKLKKVGNLLEIYIGRARSKFRNVRSHAQRRQREQRHTVSYIEDSYGQFDKRSENWMDATFRAKAAEELESWLAGYSKDMPKIFNEEEAQLLLYLYRKKEKPKQKAPIERARLRSAIRDLEGKVRIYLGDLHVE